MMWFWFVVLVFQALPTRSNEKSSPTWHGTNHAVAARVGKIPFRPHDNSHHAQHRTAAKTTPPEPLLNSTTSPTPNLDDATPQHAPFNLEALHLQVGKNMADMD